MANKKTYGKKTRPVFCTPGFSWSSPDKTASTLPPQDTEPAVDIANELQKLSLDRRASAETSAEEKEKRALKARDANIPKAQPRIKKGAKSCAAALEKHESKPPAEENKRSKGGKREIKETPLAKRTTCAIDTQTHQAPPSTKSQAATARKSAGKTRPLPECTDPLSVYTRSLLSLSRDPAARYAPTDFSEWSLALDQHFDISKIAEASYGEVYRLSLKQDVPGLTKSDESVLKLIALKPPAKEHNVAEEEEQGRRRKREPEPEQDTSWMSSVEAVVGEVKLLRRMTTIPGFTNFREIRILKGRPGKPFVTAWKAYNKSRSRDQKSIYPDPSKKLSYSSDQLWAVIEMQDAGTDLEKTKLEHIWNVWDVFWGVTIAVAKGEENARFEHRDLHLGNICIRSSRNEDVKSPSIRNTRGKLGFTGLEVTLIDYTLSRADMAPIRNESALPQTPKSGGLAADDQEVAFLDLSEDPALYEGDGDVDYQYDIYRFMRSQFFYSDPMAEYSDETADHSRSWRTYCPGTNIVWLHFILYTLLKPMLSEDADTVGLKKIAEGESKKSAVKNAARLLRRLRRLNEALDFRIEKKDENERFESATEMVEWAVEAGWLDESDVLGSVSQIEDWE